MIYRRAFIFGAGGLLFGKAPQPVTAVNFDIPAHSCDCHTHIFGSQFPLSPSRRYTTEDASPEEMAAMHRAIRVERVVIVNPSVYGTDNAATAYGLKARGKTARGIAVVDDRISDRELRAMDSAGFRGIRLNLSTAGISDPKMARARFVAAAGRMKTPGWHIQMFTSLAVIASIRDLVADAGVPVVFDHFGGAQAALGVDQPGFADLVGLLKSGHAYVKISGAYLSSRQAPDYADVTPLARALISANSSRVLWGTDWPHPEATSNRAASEVSPFRPIDDGRLLNQLALWEPDGDIRRKVLVENPERLYRF